jgi:hypothetical protein
VQRGCPAKQFQMFRGKPDGTAKQARQMTDAQCVLAGAIVPILCPGKTLKDFQLSLLQKAARLFQ